MAIIGSTLCCNRMRLLKGWAEGIFLALYLVAPAHSATSCSEGPKVSGSPPAVGPLMRSGGPRLRIRRNPWEFNTDALFTPFYKALALILVGQPGMRQCAFRAQRILLVRGSLPLCRR